MLAWLFQTDGTLVPLVVRLALAVVIFLHGAQRLLGWFGGYGFKGTMGYFTGSGIPAPLALLAIIAEFFGPLGRVLGLLTRVAAFGIACVMVVAIFNRSTPAWRAVCSADSGLRCLWVDVLREAAELDPNAALAHQPEL